MSLVWAIPVVVLLVGGAALVALVQWSAGSARELAQEIARFGELHVAVARVRAEVQRTSVHVRDIKGGGTHR